MPEKRPRTRRCHARGCPAPAEPPLGFACAAHWRLLPATLQRAVWQTYWQLPWVGPTGTRRYLHAARAAVRALADLRRARDTPLDAEADPD